MVFAWYLHGSCMHMQVPCKSDKPPLAGGFNYRGPPRYLFMIYDVIRCYMMIYLMTQAVFTLAAGHRIRFYDCNKFAMVEATVLQVRTPDEASYTRGNWIRLSILYVLEENDQIEVFEPYQMLSGQRRVFSPRSLSIPNYLIYNNHIRQCLRDFTLVCGQSEGLVVTRRVC